MLSALPSTIQAPAAAMRPVAVVCPVEIKHVAANPGTEKQGQTIDPGPGGSKL